MVVQGAQNDRYAALNGALGPGRAGIGAGRCSAEYPVSIRTVLRTGRYERSERPLRSTQGVGPASPAAEASGTSPRWVVIRADGGHSGGIRTCDTLLMGELLYRAELRSGTARRPGSLCRPTRELGETTDAQDWRRRPCASSFGNDAHPWCAESPAPCHLRDTRRRTVRPPSRPDGRPAPPSEFGRPAPPSEFGRPGQPDAPGATAQPCAAARAAAGRARAMRSTIRSSCAVETNQASNADGGR